MELRLTSQVKLVILTTVIMLFKGECIELGDAIRSQCNGTRDCIVHLSDANYTLTRNVSFNNTTLDKLALIGKSYATRIICNNYDPDNLANMKAMIRIHRLKEVFFYQLHFHNCHPARIIPVKFETRCPKAQALPSCPKYPPYFHKHKEHKEREYKTKNRSTESRGWRKFEFEKITHEWHQTSSTNIDYEVNATIWISNCYKVQFEYTSFNNFSYNAIQITNTKNTTISSLLLYSKSVNVATGYHARGLLYEIVEDNEEFQNYYLQINHSFFEDIATLSPDAEFNISSNHTIRDIKDQYGGAGAKVLILPAVTADINITHSYFKSCSALQGSGLLVYATEKVVNYSLYIERCHFVWNQAIVQTYLNPSGGALLVKQRTNAGNIFLINNQFRSNCANQGGAIGIDLRGHYRHHTFHSKDNMFDCNHANLGGAVYIENTFLYNNKIKFENTSFTRNSAGTGGAILGFNSDIEIVQSNLSSNKAYLGGAIALITSELSFKKNVSLSDNIADLKGGALYLIAYSKIRVKAGAHVLVKRNQAIFKGGGFYIFNHYQEYNIDSWLLHIDKLKKSFCFITFGDEQRLALEFEDNKVKQQMHSMHPPCMGPDMFTDTWGACYNDVKQKSTLMESNATNLNRKNCTVALDIIRYDKVSFINESLCYFKTFDKTYQPFCHPDLINIDSFPGYKKQLKDEVKRAIESFESQNRIPQYIYVIYPGFETSIKIKSRDGLHQLILTDTLVSFNQIKPKPKYDIKFKFGGFFSENIVSISSSRINFSLTNSENEWVQGKLCLNPKLSLRVIDYCIPVILSKCLPGFKIGKDDQCQFSGTPFITESRGTMVTIRKNHMMVVMNRTVEKYKPVLEDKFTYIRCTWFQCKCDSTSSKEDCTFNVLKPQDQCKPWLKGDYCTESAKPNETLGPAFSVSYSQLFTNSHSFPCRAPWIMLFLYFLISAVVTVVIIGLKIDIFADYTRSITFYSGILFLLTISCGGSGSEFIQKLITIPIILLNLKITHIYPFCKFETNGVNQAMFELLAPFTFVIYIIIMYLCIRFFAQCRILKKYKLDDKIILNQIWTILIILYTNLCSGASLAFKCQQDSNYVMRWIMNGKIICYQKEHLPLTIVAVFILLPLSLVPFILMTISCACMDGNKHIVSFYEDKYTNKYLFKYWEALKLLLRFALSLLLLIPEGSINYPCITVSIICLIMMFLTSLLQPSKSTRANHFESFCLLVLAFTGIRDTTYSRELLLDLFIIIPYIIYAIIKVSQFTSFCARKVRETLRKDK